MGNNIFAKLLILLGEKHRTCKVNVSFLAIFKHYWVFRQVLVTYLLIRLLSKAVKKNRESLFTF